MIKCSNSEIQCYKGCRRKWYLEYYLGLKPKDQELTGALALGSRVHAALALYYAPERPLTVPMVLASLQMMLEEDREKLLTQPYPDLEKFDKEARLAKIMVEGYFEWAEQEGIDSDLKMLEPEKEIEAEINVGGIHTRETTVLLLGKRDLVGVRTSTGVGTLVDFKTCQTLTDPMLDLNEQARMYLLLQRLNGSQAIQNCLWRLLRKVQRTTRAIPPFYAEESLYISDAELRLFYQRVQGELRDILDTRDKLDRGEAHQSAAYPSPSLENCKIKKCPFRVVCPMLDSEPHVQHFIEANYVKTDPYSRYESQDKDIN